MKSPMVKELKEGQALRGALFAVAQAEVRQARNGEPFMYLRLSDRTNAVDARQFERAELPGGVAPGEVVRVTGSYSSGYGIRIDHVERYTGQVNFEDFLPPCPKDSVQLGQELKRVLATIEDPWLSKLLAKFMADAWEDFQKWPGAVEVHHAYVGGLLEHTLSVVRLLDTYATLYGVNRDLLLVGGVFHDVGKLDELACKATVLYTDAGNLFGHTYLGAQRLERYATHVEGFPEALQAQLCHMVLSHHGNLEWGAVVTPMTLEAFLLHIADYTDTRAHRYGAIAEAQREKGLTFGQRDRYLETRVYSPRQQTNGEMPQP
ncbi:MAG: HD domain-containing protein [Chloroflexi bacterium]|nr:HD domain-containing protein [Chloroflexota bacterium]